MLVAVILVSCIRFCCDVFGVDLLLIVFLPFLPKRRKENGFAFYETIVKEKTIEKRVYFY